MGVAATRRRSGAEIYRQRLLAVSERGPIRSSPTVGRFAMTIPIFQDVLAGALLIWIGLPISACWRNCRKAGIKGIYLLHVLVPVVKFAALLILAFRRLPSSDAADKNN